MRRHQRTEQVYRFIVDFKASHDGNSPTVQEIADACGLASKSPVFDQLRKLESQGRIRRPRRPQRSRSIEVVGGRWDHKDGRP